jgi:phenylacetic acid degradation operon negative regulatory protein
MPRADAAPSTDATSSPESAESAAGPARAALSRRHSVGAASAPALLLTVLGEYVLPADRPAWTATLVAVLSGFGIEEKASRQALARAATAGFIVAERTGRRVRWRLTDPGRHLLTDGAERIYSFAEPAPPWDGRWLLLSATVPEGQRHLRHQLRTRLSWAGFGSPAPSLWVSPHSRREAEAQRIVADLGLGATALSFTGPFAGIGAQGSLVEQAWDLGELAGRYRSFLDEFAATRPAPGAPTLVAQARLVHQWRRFPFLDPQLPAELLPNDWIGVRAGLRFRELHARWHAEAQRYWRELADHDGT